VNFVTLAQHCSSICRYEVISDPGDGSGIKAVGVMPISPLPDLHQQEHEQQPQPQPQQEQQEQQSQWHQPQPQPQPQPQGNKKRQRDCIELDLTADSDDEDHTAVQPSPKRPLSSRAQKLFAEAQAKLAEAKAAALIEQVRKNALLAPFLC
jgi:hypothetical protein